MAEESKRFWVDWGTLERIQAVFDLCVVIFTGGLLLTSYQQWSITRESLIAVQRAFLNVKHIQSGRITPAKGAKIKEDVDGFRVLVEFENSGSTTARRVLGYFDIDRLRVEEFARFRFAAKPDHEMCRSTVGPKATMLSGVDFKPLGYWTVVDQGLVPCVWGWEMYSDVFPDTKPHLTEFCYVLRSISGDDPLTLQLNWSGCGRHMCQDEDCEDYEAVRNLWKAKTAQPNCQLAGP